MASVESLPQTDGRVPPDGQPSLSGMPSISLVSADALRDRFAISIIPGLLAIHPSINRDPTGIASLAWLIADRMVKERAKMTTLSDQFFLRAGVTEIVRQVFADGFVGVTDGSVAKPGMVGEYLHVSETVPVTAGPGPTVYNAFPVTLPPGDWDIQAIVDFSVELAGGSFGLSPVPAGMMDNLAAYAVLAGAPQDFEFGIRMSSPRGQGSFAQPTPMRFAVTLWNVVAGTGPQPQAFTISLTARRMR